MPSAVAWSPRKVPATAGPPPSASSTTVTAAGRPSHLLGDLAPTQTGWEPPSGSPQVLSTPQHPQAVGWVLLSRGSRRWVGEGLWTAEGGPTSEVPRDQDAGAPTVKAPAFPPTYQPCPQHWLEAFLNPLPTNFTSTRLF